MLLMTVLAFTVAALLLINSYNASKDRESSSEDLDPSINASLTIGPLSKKRTGVPGRRSGAGTRLHDDKDNIRKDKEVEDDTHV